MSRLSHVLLESEAQSDPSQEGLESASLLGVPCEGVALSGSGGRNTGAQMFEDLGLPQPEQAGHGRRP